MAGRHKSSTVLVLGGYGVFGGRLSRRLVARGIDVLVAGRSLERARTFCAEHGGRPLAADRDGDLDAVLAQRVDFFFVRLPRKVPMA